MSEFYENEVVATVPVKDREVKDQGVKADSILYIVFIFLGGNHNPDKYVIPSDKCRPEFIQEIEDSYKHDRYPPVLDEIEWTEDEKLQDHRGRELKYGALCEFSPKSGLKTFSDFSIFYRNCENILDTTGYSKIRTLFFNIEKFL